MNQIDHKQRDAGDAESTSTTVQSTEMVDALRQEIRRLNERITELEKLFAAKAFLPAPDQSPARKSEELPSELIVVISAAIAAYLGTEPHIRQIRLLHNHPWGQQGRVTIQASHRIRAEG